MNSYKQPARGKKRKRSAETLTPVEQRIRENEINKQRGAGPNFSVYIYPMSYIQPVKSDYDKARGRFAELTMNAGDKKLMTGIIPVNDKEARALKVFTKDRDVAIALTKLSLQIPEWGSAMEPSEPETRLRIHIASDCPRSYLKDRESTKKLVNFLLGGLIEVEDVRLTRPPCYNRNKKQTTLFLTGKEEAIKALRKRREQKGPAIHCPLTRAWMSFASKEEIFQHDLKNLNISSNISTELQNRPKSQKTSHDPDPERARDVTALTTTPLSTHSANKTA
ncbi:hypothetical protein ACHWQZ_G010515 [Mnemiopsis leidyi]